MTNETRMIGLYKKVYSSKKLVSFLTVLDYVAVSAVVIVFLTGATLAFIGRFLDGVKLILAAAIPFLIVSTARHIIDGKRPYQVYDFLEFTEKNPGRKLGESFPSRHVFSAFLISGLTFSILPVLGIVSAIAGGVLAFCRIFLGIHFIKDTVFGALIGIMSAVLGLLII